MVIMLSCDSIPLYDTDVMLNYNNMWPAVLIIVVCTTFYGILNGTQLHTTNRKP